MLSSLSFSSLPLAFLLRLPESLAASSTRNKTPQSLNLGSHSGSELAWLESSLLGTRQRWHLAAARGGSHLSVHLLLRMGFSLLPLSPALQKTMAEILIPWPGPELGTVARLAGVEVRPESCAHPPGALGVGGSSSSFNPKPSTAALSLTAGVKKTAPQVGGKLGKPWKMPR